ncbi:MAG: hypothetical protein WKG01_09810 [Kofleriaceae bacterium]
MFASLPLSLAACGGSDDPTPDAAGAVSHGFDKPTAALKANNEASPDNWVEVGPADLTCLNKPAADVATTVAVELATTVRDFQSGAAVPNASVTVFPNQDQSAPFGSAYTADGEAKVTVTIPVGTKRFGFKMTHPDAMDTLLLNQTVAPSMANQTLSAIQSVSKTTAQTLPALIGVARTPGTGVLAGSMRDCAGSELSNFIATVSSVKGTATHVAGADTYYFSPSVGLPQRHAQQPAASKDGLFMVIELATAPSAYVQVWGYETDADLAADNLTLVAELQTQVIGDVVITGSYEPLRTP